MGKVILGFVLITILAYILGSSIVSIVRLNAKAAAPCTYIVTDRRIAPDLSIKVREGQDNDTTYIYRMP